MEPMPLIDYKKYRWFFTSTNKLVVGGKSSTQNDELLKKLKGMKKEYVVMHTSSPGSPFSIILSPESKLKPTDLEETAIFTGCFSRAWRENKNKARIDIFTLSQVSKPKGFPAGRWLVKEKIEKKEVELQLSLIKQDDTLRAVPEKTLKKSKPLLKIRPGKIDKTKMIIKIQMELSDSFSKEDLLSALPPGGVTIVGK